MQLCVHNHHVPPPSRGPKLLEPCWEGWSVGVRDSEHFACRLCCIRPLALPAVQSQAALLTAVVAAPEDKPDHYRHHLSCTCPHAAPPAPPPPPPPATGPTLPPSTPTSFTTSLASCSGAYLAADNATSLLYTKPGGTGTTPPELFTLINPNSVTSPIIPGSTVVMRSSQTGLLCRLATVPTSTIRPSQQDNRPTVPPSTSASQSQPPSRLRNSRSPPPHSANHRAVSPPPVRKPRSGKPPPATKTAASRTPAAASTSLKAVAQPSSSSEFTTSALRPTRSPQPPPFHVSSFPYINASSSTGSSGQGLVCDASTVGAAALLTYTGSGISYAGQQLSCTEPGQPVVLGSSTTGTGGATLAPLQPTTPGTALIPQQPYSLETSPGQYVKVDNFSSPAYVSQGNGSSPSETFTFINPTDPTGPVNPGEPVLVKSGQTGMYCRVANTSTTAAGSAVRSNTLRSKFQVVLPSQSATPASAGMICDVASPSYATNFTWTGTTITYNGASLSAPSTSPTSPTQPATFSNSTTNTAVKPTFEGPNIDANQPVAIRTNSGCLAVNNTREPIYVDSLPCSSTNTAQQFLLQPAYGSTTATAIAPGERTIIKSVETGLYCRVALVGPGQQGLLCDVTNPSQATAVTYTGTGFAYGGQPLAAIGSGQPLLVSPGATSSTSGLTLLQLPASRPPPTRRPPPQKQTVAPPPKQGGNSSSPPPTSSRRCNPPRSGTTTTTRPPPSPKTIIRGAKPPPAKLLHTKPPPAKLLRSKPPPPGSASSVAVKSKPPPSQVLRAARPPPKIRQSPAAGASLGTGAKLGQPPPIFGTAWMTPVPAAARQQHPDVTQREEAAVLQGGAASCQLQAGDPCGGIGMCGVDGACQGHCCSAGSTCTRHSAFTWTCA